MSLHILLPRGRAAGTRLVQLASRPADPAVSVENAYASLGWRPPPQGAAASRGVRLARHADYLSVYDSTSVSLDDGVLPGVAAHVSRALNTAAVAVAASDAGSFAFVLFHRGKQVDAVCGNQDDTAWITVRGHPQAALWRSVFGMAHMARLEPAGQDRLADPMAIFTAQAGAASRLVGAPDNAALGAWCRLAGLPLQALQIGQLDAAGAPALELSPAPVPRAPRKRVLRFDAAEADCPYHGFYPAAWPVAAGETQSFAWKVVCSFRGLARPRLALHIDRTGGFALRKVSLEAYGLHNGQITSAIPVAHFGQSLAHEEGLEEADFCFDADGFALPDPVEPGGGYLLVMRAEMTAPRRGEAIVTPTLRAAGAKGAPFMLPTLRLAVTGIAWAPVVADPLDETPMRREAVLRLNAPSVHNFTAILADTGDDIRAALKHAAETFLAPMTATPLVASLHTEHVRHAGEAVPRADRSVPLRTLLQDKAWERLFDAASHTQTVRIGISLQDAPWPLAGIVLQTSLSDQQEGEGDITRFGGPTLAASFWAIAEDSALALLGLDVAAARNSFAHWIRGMAPLQAWCAECAWIPAFDRYGLYTLTPYEAAADVDWFGRGLAGTLTDRAWLRRRLRFVAPLLWLGWEMAELVDATKMTSFAHVTQIEDGLEIALHDVRELARLEKALLPILPIKL